MPDPAFESVCYSMLAPDRALSIPGRFAVQDERIAALELPAASTAVNSGAQQARDAQRWYRQIRAESFAG
jgi:hypothetical protein